MKYRHAVMKKIRDSARDQPCVWCKRDNGTTVWAHYFGPRRHEYGGGMGHKGHDAVGAWLCRECHHIMDTLNRNKDGKWELSEEFLHCCALTWIQLIEQEIIK